MTHEDFAHICLKIRSGALVEIPCCANCRYYGKKYYKYIKPDKDEYVCSVFRFGTNPEDFCSRFVDKNDKNW